MTEVVNRSDQDHFDDLTVVPRKLGITNLLNFPARGPGSIAILVFLFGMAIMGWIGTLEFFATRVFFFVTKSVEGQVLWVDETNITSGDVEVYKTGFVYQVNGKSFESFSYDVGGRYVEGATVTVVYSTINPGIAKVRDLEYSVAGWFHLVPALLFFAALLLAGWGITRWIFLSRLLIHGKPAKATISRTEETNIRVNEQPVIDYFFGFKDEHGNDGEIKVRTHNPEKITDDMWELVLYDPRETSKAFLMDQLPFEVVLKEPGKWAPSPKGIPFIRLLLLGFAGLLASTAVARLMTGLF